MMPAASSESRGDRSRSMGLPPVAGLYCSISLPPPVNLAMPHTSLFLARKRASGWATIPLTPLMRIFSSWIIVPSSLVLDRHVEAIDVEAEPPAKTVGVEAPIFGCVLVLAVLGPRVVIEEHLNLLTRSVGVADAGEIADPLEFAVRVGHEVAEVHVDAAVLKTRGAVSYRDPSMCAHLLEKRPFPPEQHRVVRGVLRTVIARECQRRR